MGHPDEKHFSESVPKFDRTVLVTSNTFAMVSLASPLESFGNIFVKVKEVFGCHGNS